MDTHSFWLLQLFALFFLHIPQSISGSSQPVTNAVTNLAVNGVAQLKKTLNALNNNVGRKISINKHMKLGELGIRCSLRSNEVDPYTTAGTQLIPISARRQGALINLEDATVSDLIDEVRIDMTLDINPSEVASGGISIDIPKTVDLFGLSRGEIISRGYVDLKESIKRFDFLYKNADWVLHGAYNRKSGESSLHLLKHLEDAYILKGKYVSVTPKLELVFDKKINENSNFCLSFRRGKDSITPIIYPLARKFEFLAEKAITEELKAGFFWSKDNRLFMNLSFSLPWGKSGWQTIAFRFVFPHMEKSHVHLTNEITLS